MEVNNKRIKLKTLIRERKKVLNDLGIKLAVDPFDRIKIDEQLEIIELLGKNLQGVLLIKEKIKEKISFVDQINVKNRELYFKINQKVELFNDRNSMADIINENDIEIEHNQIDKKKVISVRDISSRINLSLIYEKTNGVINRVYELFNNVLVTEKKEDVVPQLVIEKDNVVGNQAIGEDADKVSAVDSELFSEVNPFEETVLFADKYDDVFSEKVSVDQNNNDEMPELFFESDQRVFDDAKVESKELSLDEQIKALKLVA